VVALAAALALLRHRAGRDRPAAAAAWSTVPGLARRGRALADRQLQLLGQLARDEPDPHRRQGLAGIDHLATRLRRTAETLLAMTGPARPGAGPTPSPWPPCSGAAIAEAEAGNRGPVQGPADRGRRVELLTTGEVEVAGPAGQDLAHLLAELLDNAAAYSPPTAPVVVTGSADGHGYLLEVRDRGLGMTGQELAWANQRLTGRRRPRPGRPGRRRPARPAGRGPPGPRPRVRRAARPLGRWRRHRHRAPARGGALGPSAGPRATGLTAWARTTVPDMSGLAAMSGIVPHCAARTMPT
jgi:hypothetical protein